MSEEREVRALDYFSSPLPLPEFEPAVEARADAASATEVLVPSVNLVASTDQRLNSPSGRPTARYGLIAGCGVLEGLHFLAGTCVTPGLLR